MSAPTKSSPSPPSSPSSEVELSNIMADSSNNPASGRCSSSDCDYRSMRHRAHQYASPSSPVSSLTSMRRRRTTRQGRNNANNNRSRYYWRWSKPKELSEAQEATFLNMQLRKNNRALTGTKSRDTTYEFVSLAILLIIIFSAGAQDCYAAGTCHTEAFVYLTFGQVVMVGVYVFLAVFVTSVFRESKFVELLFWMFIYLPLVAIMLALVFDRTDQDGNAKGYAALTEGQIIGILLLVAEGLVLFAFILTYYLYPLLINSEWFRRSSGAVSFWKVGVVADWTFSYTKRAKSRIGLWGRRHVCKYDGDKDPETGLPHGIGRWFDDSADGEILLGHWRDGQPVAPFFSRQFKTGDAFSAVRIAYVLASDDDIASSNFWPTNDEPPRCGVASVECSVSGAFYNELPRTTHYVGPFPYNPRISASEIMLRNLVHFRSEEETNVLHVKANDPRGVQVAGHVCDETGKSFNDVDQIIVTVRRHYKGEGRSRSNSSNNNNNSTGNCGRPGLKFMPIATGSFRKDEEIAVSVRECDPGGDGESDDVASSPADASAEGDGYRRLDDGTPDVPLSQAEGTCSVYQCLEEDNSPVDATEVEEGAKPLPARLSLEVIGWTPSKQKDALVFIPGFNCPLKKALNSFGQLVAMTKLDSHVYPILYEWPCGTVLTYHSASRAAATERNRHNFSQLMRGLQCAGVHNVHIMSHSMGAQTLLGSFCDEDGDGSRSEVSRCFHLASDCDAEFEEEDDNLLVCKTITMLNPDFPLESFVNRTFQSVRRICSNITVVGDRKDQALFWSQLINGAAVYCGYTQPDTLQPNQSNKDCFGQQLDVGKAIDHLYLPDNIVKAGEYEDYQIFKEKAPLVLVNKSGDNDEGTLDKLWLDLDVIDTTGLDTNVANIRHSAYNLNPSLLNDLEELVTTGNRAMKRPSLLYRDGNIFSYCHAPSYVAM